MNSFFHSFIILEWMVFLAILFPSSDFHLLNTASKIWTILNAISCSCTSSAYLLIFWIRIRSFWPYLRGALLSVLDSAPFLALRRFLEIATYWCLWWNFYWGLFYKVVLVFDSCRLHFSVIFRWTTCSHWSHLVIIHKPRGQCGASWQQFSRNTSVIHVTITWSKPVKVEFQ